MRVTKNTIMQAISTLEGTLLKKNHDYGNSVEEQYNEYGISSLLIRCEDKLRRLKNLAKDDDPIGLVEEPIEETFLDLAGYALLAHIIHAFTDEEIQEISGFEIENGLLREENKRHQKEIQRLSYEIAKMSLPKQVHNKQFDQDDQH